MTSSPGFFSHLEASMFRISADTRVLDCAEPFIVIRVPFCDTSVR